MSNLTDEKEPQASDLEKLWEAVRAMRAAQKLEWAALPGNLRLWKRARQQQTVSRLEEKVDGLVQELQRTYRWKDVQDRGKTPEKG